MKPDSHSSAAPSEQTEQLLGYDASGEPLYGTPATPPPPVTPSFDFGTAFQNQPYTAPVSSAIVDPKPPRRPDSPRSDAVREEVREKHEQSCREYPFLDLTDTEYVITILRRHIIGLLAPLIGGGLLICLVIAGVICYPTIMEALSVTDPPNVGIIALIGILLCLIIGGFTYISVWLYRSNKLILTNESLVRNVQISLFSKDVRSISLGDIGGVNYLQTGLLQTMLGYGTVKINTRGNDNIYQLPYTIDPRQQVTTIEGTVEEYKERFGVDHRF